MDCGIIVGIAGKSYIHTRGHQNLVLQIQTLLEQNEAREARVVF